MGEAALRILCLDFDGVCHSYTSGWKRASVIEDDPVPGLFDFIDEARKEFEINVFSSRSTQPHGIDAMDMWFDRYWRRWLADRGRPYEPLGIQFPTHKPAAYLTIDDRCLQFVGIWPRMSELNGFKPWNK
jgi:hypothetical protein